jgi:urease accessory protein
LTASIADGALLVIAPDPVQCFAGSCYEQRQRFDLAKNAAFVLVDWMSSGRSARGERWSFVRYSSRIEIWRNAELLLLDNLLLDSSEGALENRFRTGGFDCLATVVVAGDALAGHARAILSWVGEEAIDPQATFAFAASPLREGVLLRFGGTNVEQIGHEIQRHLSFVQSLLVDDPWRRKW